MSDHDEMCPAPGSTLSGCICADLRKRDARVRADEQEQMKANLSGVYAGIRATAAADERKRIVKYLVDMGYEGAAFLLTSGESNA